MYGKFTLTIELGNEAMQTEDDVANALKRAAEDVGKYGFVNHTIRDLNGNKVGRYDFDIETEDEEEVDDEAAGPQEDDITTEDHMRFYQHGKLAVSVAIDDDWRKRVREHMDAEQFWPNVWFISDHGNVHLLKLDEEG